MSDGSLDGIEIQRARESVRLCGGVLDRAIRSGLSDASVYTAATAFCEAMKELRRLTEGD